MDTQTHPNGLAPSTSRYRMGSRGGRTAEGLQRVWDRLSPDEFRDAMGIADSISLDMGLSPASIRSYLYALAAEGHLERRPVVFTVQVERKGMTFPARRRGNHFRIVPDA